MFELIELPNLGADFREFLPQTVTHCRARPAIVPAEGKKLTNLMERET
jgi:hypothetical protein